MSMIEALEAGYLLALQIPHGKLRLENQDTLCKMRDAIADASGLTGEQVQNEFETLAMRKQLDDAALKFMLDMAQP